MIYHYNKLVRDKIPENINSVQGRKANWKVLNEGEYSKELDKKLLEEVHEFIEAHEVEELADVMEVLENIIRVHHINLEDVKEKQRIKRDKKGGFKDRVYLEFVEEQERNVHAEQELNKNWRKNNSLEL